MTKFSRLPVHTLRYFAEQAFKSAFYNGRYTTSHTTKEGIKLLAVVSLTKREVLLGDGEGGEWVIKIPNSWYGL